MDARISGIASGRRTWLVTGGAGFIGSHLVDRLLTLGQRVRVLDNFETGRRTNLESAAKVHGESLEVIDGDIRSLDACRAAAQGSDVILHQAALGSVPRSILDPLTTHATNVTGFLNVLWAAREHGIRRVVYASSSSVYGDHPGLPKEEDLIGRQLSPYAVSKYSNELYAHAFGLAYGMELLGLRYFNVFGPRQDPSGPYAAVIPVWFQSLLQGSTVFVNGDGTTSRDFCFVENVVQANLLAATTDRAEAIGKVYNVAVGDRTTLLELFEAIRTQVALLRPGAANAHPVHRDERAGDVRHSLADISRARRLLGYEPTVKVAEGLARAAEWYLASP